MSAESPRHARTGGPLTVASQPPSDRGLIDAVSGFINDVTLSSSSTIDPKDVIQWARFETTDINDPTPEGDSDNDISPLLLILGYGSGVQVWLIPPSGEAQEVLSWRQGTVRVLRVLPTPQHGDCFAVKRPLIALCDSASPGPSFCSLSFISIRGGEQVKSIKFKNQILDVLANKRSVVISFSERFAVFDAGTLEDRMAVTTCYPCPCPLGGSLPVNPLALGDRWLAYADKKLNPTKRSSGGCEGEGVTSYTATVLHAAKSLSKGLRGLGESVAHSLAGGRSTSQSPSPPNADIQQPGVVTILDIEGIEEEDGQDTEEPCDPIIAHFLAHSDAIIALKFDSSGLLLVTADRRGHDFHVFRINPHPCGPSLASVHHLYILHRGDTTAKVQDIAISPDSRWAAISTLRGTTHVFAVSPYGGPCGVRTHSQPRVVNRLSRFHRSAGLPIHAAASKRGSPTPVGDGLSTGSWFPNPRLPPYPLPTTAGPLAQLRPTANIPTHTITRNSSGRQRLSSLSEDSNAAPLLARARFGLATAPTSVVAGGLARPPASPVAALYLMAANGSLLHLLLHPKPLSSLPKEKICDDSPIELEVEPVAQWPLQRPPAAADLLAPLPPSNPLLQHCRTYATRCTDMCMSEEERWLSQVEIVTHAGPHRRLWMGPQFVFKTYNCTGSNSSLSEAETVEVDTSGVARSNPVNMPGVRPVVPVLVDSGSASSLEHSPSDSFRRKSLLAESGRATSVCDVQLREDLAEAMKEDHGLAREVTERPREQRTGVARAVDPQGTVVQPSPSVPPDPEPDVELYVSSNCDEATFRPVVRAPAPLATRPEAMARPLPRTTTIPVQSVPSAVAPESPPDPLPLNTAVVIPAALTAWPHSNDRNETNPSFSLDKDIITESETKNARSIECEKGSANTERERQEHESLPNSNRSSGDIQPAARPRVKKSPTPKSDCDRVADDDSSKDRKSSKGKISSRDIDRGNDLKKNAEERKQTQNPKKEKNEIVEIAPVVEPVRIDKPLKEPSPISVTEAKQSTKVEVKEAKVVQKIVEVASKAMEPITPLSVETKTTTVQETVEKGTATTIDENIKQSDATTFNKSAKSKKSTKKEKETVSSESTVKESAKEADIKTQKTEVTSTAPLKKSKKKETVEQPALIEPIAVVISKDEKQVPDEPIPAPVQTTKPMKKAPTVSKSTPITEDEKIIEKSEVKPISSVKEPIKIEVVETKALLKIDEDDLKTEDQVWDMLLNESEKSMTVTESPMMSEKYTEDPKPKSKKSRRVKKSQEDTQEKDDDDSFVEIHAIDDKQQSCGELVSISTLFDDLEPVSIVPKVKKGRSSKSITPERKECIKTECAEYGLKNQEEFSLVTSFKNQHSSFTSRKRDDFDNEPIWGFQQYELAVHTDESVQDDNKTHNFSETVKKNAIPKTGTAKMDKLNVADITITENTTIGKESSKGKPKSKSTSPYSERKSSEKRHEIEVKDVYVIDTVNDEFPEIQITKGNKMRKKSPQPDKKTPDKEPDIKSPDIEIVEKPVKSWSSIAASKNVKKEDKVVEENILPAKETVSEIENEGSSTQVSLQEKLMELCKRTDIMVAECDMPSELNFVEEHHSVLELPPLEPLDFGLDDFKMEVMRDSLLETNDTLTSPICKINIDSILSTIRETTSKAIESSAFNLIDLEKVPLKKEKGFSVVENDKIKTQEVKIDDDKSDKEVMEKSSEDDIASPVVSTDSDKEDKKNGASNVTMPSSKQSSKSKKSRKKKK